MYSIRKYFVNMGIRYFLSYTFEKFLLIKGIYNKEKGGKVILLRCPRNTNSKQEPIEGVL